MSNLAQSEQDSEARLIANAQHLHDFREEISIQQGQQSERQRTSDIYQKLNDTYERIFFYFFFIFYYFLLSDY